MTKKRDFYKRNHYNGGGQGKRGMQDQPANREEAQEPGKDIYRNNGRDAKRDASWDPNKDQNRDQNQTRSNGRSNAAQRQNYSSQRHGRGRREETVEDIKADIQRIEKEIELEIKEIRSLKL